MAVAELSLDVETAAVYLVLLCLMGGVPLMKKLCYAPQCRLVMLWP